MDVYAKRKLKARVISQKGTCEAGHKVGDEFIISDVCPRGLCAWAFLHHVSLCAGANVRRQIPMGKGTGQMHSGLL